MLSLSIQRLHPSDTVPLCGAGTPQARWSPSGTGTLFLKEYSDTLIYWKGRANKQGGKRQSAQSSWIHWFTPQMAETLRRRPDFTQVSQVGGRASTCSSSTVFPGQQQEAGLEVKQPGLKAVPRRDTGIAVRGSGFATPVPAPAWKRSLHYFKGERKSE